MIDAAQVRAARGLLDLTQIQLAKLASVSIATIKRVEAAAVIRGSAEVVWKIESALESAGIEFISADEGKGPGVRLRKPAGRGRTKAKR